MLLTAGSVIAFCSLKHGTSTRPQELFPSPMSDPGGKKETFPTGNLSKLVTGGVFGQLPSSWQEDSFEVFSVFPGRGAALTLMSRPPQCPPGISS
jgi:hypothetical protein